MDKFFSILPTIVSALSGGIGIFLGKIHQQRADKRKSVMYPLDYSKLSKSRDRTTRFALFILIVVFFLFVILLYFGRLPELLIVSIFFLTLLWVFIEHLYDPTDGMPMIPSFEYNNERLLVINTLTNDRILVVPENAYDKSRYPSSAFVLNEDVLLEKEIIYTTISGIYKPNKIWIITQWGKIKKRFNKSKQITPPWRRALL